MLVTDIVNINGKDLRRNYSDSNFMIRKVGSDKLYCEAIDVLTAGYTYEETDIAIGDNVEAEEALKIITEGVV